MDAIVVRNLTKRFGGFTAVDGLDFTVPAGSVFGFLGHNGAGKTTTIKILTGLSTATSGEVAVLGEPWSRKSLDAIGLLPENPAFFNWMSGRECLLFLANLAGLSPREQTARADEMLALTGLTEAAKRACGGYSRGMKQRLGLAAALIHRPKIVILDEPTSALDPEGRREVLDLIGTLRDQGMTVFISSHILDDIERIADTVLIIKGGHRIVGGPLSDLLNEHAKPIIDVQFVAPPPAAAIDRLAALPGVRRATSSGETVTLLLQDAKRQEALFGELAGLGLAVAGLQVRRPTLEDVYLSATNNNGAANGGESDD